MASPGWTKQFKAPNPPEADPRPGPPDTLAYSEQIPAAVLRDLRTLSALQERSAIVPTAAQMVRLAIPVAEQIRDAAIDGRSPGGGCLRFRGRDNQLTGKRSVIIYRHADDGTDSRPLAELLTADHELTEAAKSAASALDDYAVDRRLSLVPVRAPSGKGREPYVLLAGRPEQQPRRGGKNVTYLARILVTPFEVAQWRDPDTRWIH